MSMTRTILLTALTALTALTGLLGGCSGIQKHEWPICAVAGGVAGAALGVSSTGR